MHCYEAETEAAFIWHLAVNLVSRGYVFYVMGEIPWHKEPAKTDAKILHHYGVAISKWQRFRNRERGEAGIQYLRHKRQFVILATDGDHRFFEDEAEVLSDIRRDPLKIAEYSIGLWKGKPGVRVSVRIENKRFQQIKVEFREKCVAATVEELIGEICSFSFLPFVPITRQLFILLGTVNKARAAAGLERIPPAVILRQRLPRGTYLNRGFERNQDRVAVLRS